MEGEWISAARALQIVASALTSGAHSTICSRAFDGLIRARARRLVAGTRVRDDCPIPEGFWWARGKPALSQNWATGDFATTVEGAPWRVYGVEFSLSDIEQMLPPKQRIEFDRASPGNYASAASCLDELRSAVGCSASEAEQLILRAARAGLVAGRCANISWRVTDRYGSRDEQDSNIAIPDWFWDHCTVDPDAVLNWRAGRFAGRGIVDDDEYKVTVAGVELLVSDIIEIESEIQEQKCAEDSSALLLQQVASGRRQSDRWRPWVAEVVAYVHENGIPEGQGSQGQEELIRAVADSLAQRGIETLGRSTVQPVVQAVLDRLRGPAEK